MRVKLATNLITTFLQSRGFQVCYLWVGELWNGFLELIIIWCPYFKRPRNGLRPIYLILAAKLALRTGSVILVIHYGIHFYSNVKNPKSPISNFLCMSSLCSAWRTGLYVLCISINNDVYFCLFICLNNNWSQYE